MFQHIRMSAATWLAVALVVGVFAACGAPIGTPTSTVPPGTPTAPLPSLRSIDFTAAPYAADLTRRAGGGDVIAERVRLVDLTGDGAEEAVVVVESGGTLGDLGVGVYQPTSAGPSLAYFRKLAGRVEIRQSALVILEGVPSPGDAACCPSQVRESTVEWRNGTFEVTSERTTAAPGATSGPAATPR